MESHFIFHQSLIIGFMLETNGLQIKDYAIITLRREHLFELQKMKEEEERWGEGAGEGRERKERSGEHLVLGHPGS